MKRNRIPALLLAVLLLLSCAPLAAAWESKGEYSEGMIPATDGAKWGYANASGVLAIPLRFEEAAPFALGVALVRENGKQGLLRQDGAWLLEPVYSSLASVGRGVYIGVRDGVYQLLSTVPFPGPDGKAANVLVDGAASIAPVTAGEEGARYKALSIQYPGVEDTELIALNDLPALLRKSGADGWAFPLSASKTAAFPDVNGRDWFDLWVDLSYSTGLMEGPGDGKFWPYKTLTVGEALKLAAVLDSRVRGASVPGGDPWYAGALTYCVKYGIVTEDTFDSYTRPITRAELALVFAATAPMKDAADLNDAQRVQSSIPDVSSADFAASAIYALYTKGILSGSDKQLTFRPGAIITRSEVAAIAARLARPEQRVTLWGGGFAPYQRSAAQP